MNSEVGHEWLLGHPVGEPLTNDEIRRRFDDPPTWFRAVAGASLFPIPYSLPFPPAGRSPHGLTGSPVSRRGGFPIRDGRRDG